MSATKFTPGPWVVGKASSFGETDIRTADDGNVAMVFGAAGADAPHYANAHLIAAAPDMAAFVKKHADAGDSEAAALWEKLNGRG